MTAIYKRELRSYFNSFIGLLFIGASLFFVGLYFTNYHMLYGYPYFSYTVSGVQFIFLITVPVLCMKILAEERHNKTDQLIITAPVSVGKIVAGKFFALLTIFAVPTAVSGIYPLVMSAFGDTPMGENYTALLAYFLYGMAAIAIGVLVSALTESQVIAAVLSFGILFLMYMMQAICGMISTEGNLLTELLSVFDMYTPYVNLLNGILDIKSIVYFVTLTWLALFLTTQAIQKRRFSVSVKQFSMGAYSSGMMIAAVAVSVLVNMVAAKLPETWTAVDMTEEKLFSLTDQTKEYVKGLEEDIDIYVLAPEENADETLAKSLMQYEDLSDHITVTYVNPTVNPGFASQYTSDSVNMNSVIVVSDKRSKVIDYYAIYAMEINYSTYQYESGGYDGEGQITSAIDYVLNENLPKLYMTEGHGEHYFSDSFEQTLAKENIEYVDINLMNYDAVPEDASCLLIYAPENDFNAEDAKKVVTYLEQGGKVIFVSGSYDREMPNCQTVLDYMGIELASGLVVETDRNHYYQSPTYLLPKVSYSTYTSGISNTYYIFAPYAQGFVVPDSTEEITYDKFLTTSDKAYSKTNLASATIEMEETDIAGPFAIGVEAVKTLEEGEATMVAYSCSELFSDDASVMVSGANQMMFANTISAFSDHDVTVSIPVKSTEMTYLTANSQDALLIGMITIIALPVGCILAGFVIWFRRRRK